MKDLKYEAIRNDVEQAVRTCLEEDRAGELSEEDNIRNTVDTILDAVWGKEG